MSRSHLDASRGPKLAVSGSKIQEIVDEMNLAEYSNLGSWTKSLDKKVESILLYRMSNAMAIWVKIHTLKNKKIENMNTSPTKDKGERKYSIGSAIENEEGVEAKNEVRTTREQGAGSTSERKTGSTSPRALDAEV